MNQSRPAPNAPKLLRISVCLFVLLAAGCVSGAAEPPNAVSAADRAAVDAAVQVALEANQSGVARPWQNPDTGNHGTVLPVRTYQTASGLFCRDYIVIFVDGGASRNEQDTACRDIDGTWKDGA